MAPSSVTFLVRPRSTPTVPRSTGVRAGAAVGTGCGWYGWSPAFWRDLLLSRQFVSAVEFDNEFDMNSKHLTRCLGKVPGGSKYLLRRYLEPWGTCRADPEET